jgi:hypothetical protein
MGLNARVKTRRGVSQRATEVSFAHIDFVRPMAMGTNRFESKFFGQVNRE